MADGNMGKLWFELGIRDKSNEKLNAILKSVQNLDGAIAGIHKAIKDADKSEYKALSNALNYLRMLQQIEQEKKKINDLRSLSPGMDTSKLESALRLLNGFRDQLYALQSNGKKGGGGVDDAYITGFQQALRNTMVDVKALESAFKSENTLSVFKSNVARLTNELEKAKNKLAEIYSMQSYGMKNGFDTRSLLGAGNSLRGVKKRLERALNNPGSLGEAQEKKLVSDIALAYTKVAGKVAEYNREKQKSIEATKSEAAKQKEVEKATEETNRAKKRAAELERQHQQEIANTATKIRTDLASAYDKVNQNAGKTNELVRELKTLFLQGGVVYGARNLVNSIIQTGGEIEQQHIALRSILGDRAKADELFEQTQQLALQSPFKFGELNRDTKQLAAFGVQANELYETTKRIADISSGLGVDFGRLGLAFGQVKARAWLDGKELRQFAYAGLPMLQKITDMYNREGKNGRTNYTTGDVKTMISKREVSFDDVKKVLWELTDEGGQFYNMQFVLSETLLGRYNKLIDAWDIMLGKFADGDNIVSSVFKSMLDGATNLVLALDRLSPLLLGIGAGFATKKLIGAGASTFNSLVTNGKQVTGLGKQVATLKMAQAEELKLYAIEQQRLVASGAITKEQASALVMKRAYLLSDEKTVANQMAQLAIQGRLNVFQLQSAYRQGLITGELVQQLQIMGIISQKQGELIMKEGILARLKAGGSVVGSKLSGLMSFGVLAGIGATVGLALWQGYSQYKDKIKQDADNIADSAKEHLKSLSETYEEVATMGSGEELQGQVDKMKDVLEQSGYYTDSIKEQIEYARTLQDEYAILKKKIAEAKEVNAANEKYAPIIADAKAMSGNAGGGRGVFAWMFGLLNDTFDTNINDISTPLARMQIALEAFGEGTKKKMNEVADSILGPKAAAMSLEEKLGELARIDNENKLSQKGKRVWSDFLESVGDKDVQKKLQGIATDAKTFGRNLHEITDDDIPKMVDGLAKGMDMTGAEFAEWARKNPTKFRGMLDEMLSAAESKTPDIVARLREIAYATLGIAEPKTPKHKGPKAYRSGLNPGTPARIIRDRMNKGNFYYRGDIDPMMRTLQANTWEGFGDNVRKKYKSIKDEIDAKKAAKIKYNDRELRLLEAIAEEAGIDLDTNKRNTNNNNDKTDKELKNLQDRLQGFKSARQTYQNYKSVMGEVAAKDTVVSLFPEIKGLDFNDYEGSIKAILKGFDGNATEERRKFISDTNKELADWRFSEILKPEWERISKDFQEALEKAASQFDLYKTLFEKTGSKEFSMQAFANGSLWDDQSLGLAEQFKEITGMDADVDASDATVKHYLVDVKGLQKAYDLWKKIVDLVKGNFTEALKTQAELIEKSLNYEEQIQVINNKYDKIISDANKTGNSRAVAAANIQRNKEIGTVKLKQFKNSSDYLDFYGAIMSLGLGKAQIIGNKIRNNINEALRSGSIDAREYAKEIKQLNEQLDKITKSRKSFLNGGLKGIIEQRKADANEKFTLATDKIGEGRDKITEGTLFNDINLIYEGAGEVLDGEDMQEDAEKLHKKAIDLEEVLNAAVNIAEIFSTNIQGVCDAFNDIKETATVLGIDTESDDWQNATAFFSSLSGINSSISNIVKSAESGNIGGILSGVVGIFTSPIKSIAQAHDNKLERQIKLAEEQLSELKNLSSNITSLVESTLGGIYNYQRSGATSNKFSEILKQNDFFNSIPRAFRGNGVYSNDTISAIDKANSSASAYYDQIALLKAQRDQIQKQRNSEASKKDSDSSKIADYDQQLIEMDQTIKTFAQDFLKSMYSIDFKSWASELTDAVVSAWQNGEDAVQAWHDKAKELVTDLTKNIISQKIVEQALQPALDYLTKELDDNNGVLTESSIIGLGKKLNEAGDNAVTNITNVLEMLKKNGWDLSDSTGSSTTNSIKNVTEETADLLASYINSIRLDVSVNRDNIQKITDSIAVMPEMSVIAKSQLSSLNQLVTLATYRNDVLDDMYRWMRNVSDGTKQVYMK